LSCLGTFIIIIIIIVVVVIVIVLELLSSPAVDGPEP
jgi:hypothetical protein